MELQLRASTRANGGGDVFRQGEWGSTSGPRSWGPLAVMGGHLWNQSHIDDPIDWVGNYFGAGSMCLGRGLCLESAERGPHAPW